MSQRDRRGGRAARIARAVWVSGLVLAAILGGTPPAGADEVPEEPKQKTRRVKAVNEYAYKKLQGAHELLGEDKTKEARAVMDEMSRKKGLNEHEKALMWQTYGWIYSAEENYAKAAQAFEKCLSFPEALPLAAEMSTRYNLAQVYMVMERFDDAIPILVHWLGQTPNPSGHAYYMLGTAYAQKEDWRKALSYATKAVAKATPAKPPKQAWLQLQLASNFELQNYAACARVLEKLVELYPKKMYWVQLASMYTQIDEGRKSMATLEIAYRQGLLDKPSELKNLAQLYMYYEIPYKAAKLMEKGIEDGILEKDAETLELLGNAWMYAREFDSAVGPLSEAASMSQDGELYMRLGQVYAEREEWSKARDVLSKALAKGDLDDPGNAQLLVGMANFNTKRYGAARQAFARAAKYEKTRNSAQSWLQYLERQQELEAQQSS